MQEFDFAIVGAGIAGVSVAYHLAPQKRVVILEREHVPAYHTTGRSAALHSETYGSPEIRAITVVAGRFYRKPPPGFADHRLLAPRGALTAGRAEQEAALRAAAADYAKLVPSVRWLEPAEAQRRMPLFKPDAIRGGAVFEPEADDMDVASIHGGFLRGARAAGALLRLEAEVVRLERKDGRWLIGLRDGDAIAAANVINASGAWADVLAGLAGARPVGLVPKRRTAFTFDSPPGLEIEHLPMAIDFDETFYFKPEVGQFLASPADETPSPPCDAQPEEMDIAIAVDRIESATSLEIRRIKNKWAGLRSFVADKNLVVGYDANVAGFFWLAGQGGYGIQTGAAAGRLAASLALGRGLPSDIAELGVTEVALSPARFTPR
ncbi:FAD-binding oxidoreductase [Enhydrobacter sp.]|jgi:D-arginine dehydrogenase|uniref:NAD(P)/FAD-dependent oxidoreductase n=1 Tax=Enhydrobacter sp. TaxID=1894999 RepID=UPI00261962D0|nr:FAD-binding oxidoreductase [Enhydrobacter sp.]WIM09905.1 MAG: Sarcosine oxidase beta subunit [Enhydrobacter sp.]